MNEIATHSVRFTRAAEAESERLLRHQQRAEAEVKKAEKRLHKAQRELETINERLVVLSAITSGAPSDGPIEKPSDAEGQRSPLRGARIREVAVEVLRERKEDRGVIHYKRWLELLEDAGYLVAGKRPEAVFLGQLMRSPVVRATTRPGYYELDELAADAAREKVRNLEAELNELSARMSESPRDLERLIEQQQELIKELRQAQRDWKEAVETLDGNGADVVQIAA